MKFLADECCDASLVEHLREDGHDVVYVVESMRGARDAEVLQCAFEERRFLRADRLKKDSVQIKNGDVIFYSSLNGHRNQEASGLNLNVY